MRAAQDDVTIQDVDTLVNAADVSLPGAVQGESGVCMTSLEIV